MRQIANDKAAGRFLPVGLERPVILRHGLENPLDLDVQPAVLAWLRQRARLLQYHQRELKELCPDAVLKAETAPGGDRAADADDVSGDDASSAALDSFSMRGHLHRLLGLLLLLLLLLVVVVLRLQLGPVAHRDALTQC
eukprot:gene5747-1778_t